MPKLLSRVDSSTSILGVSERRGGAVTGKICRSLYYYLLVIFDITSTLITSLSMPYALEKFRLEEATHVGSRSLIGGGRGPP